MATTMHPDSSLAAEPPAEDQAGAPPQPMRTPRPEYLGDVRSAARPRRLIDATAITIILFQGVAYVLLALRGSLYADDLREASRAAADPWSLDWIIGFGTYRHFAPLERGWVSFLVSVAPLNLAVAVAAAALAQVVVTALLWLLLRRLTGPTWAAVLGLGTYAVLPMAIPVFLWNLQAVVTLPVMGGGLAAAHGLLGWWRSRRWGWIVLAFLGLLVAALTWEKWLAIPFLLALFVLAVLSPSLRPGAMVRSLLAVWPIWVACAVLLIPYTVIWVAGDFDTDAPPADPAAALEAWGVSLTDLVFPNFLGGPWSWAGTDPTNFYPSAATPSWAVALTAAAIAVVLTLASRRVPAAVARLLLLVVGATTVVVVPPILGRLSQFGIDLVLAPRYLIDVMPWLAVAVTLLAARWAAAAARRPRWLAIVATLAALVVAAGTVLTTALFAVRWWENPVGGFVATFRSSASALLSATSSDSLAVFDGEAPPQVLTRWFTPYNKESEILLPLTRGTGISFGRGDSAWIIDDSGRLVPGRFESLDAVSTVGCVPVAGPDESSVLPLAGRRVHSPDLTARLEIRVDRPVGLSLGAQTEDGQVDADSITAPQRRLEPGVTTMYVLLPPRALTGIWLRADAADSGLCVQSAELGTPVAVGEAAP